MWLSGVFPQDAVILVFEWDSIMLYTSPQNSIDVATPQSPKNQTAIFPPCNQYATWEDNKQTALILLLDMNQGKQ